MQISIFFIEQAILLLNKFQLICQINSYTTGGVDIWRWTHYTFSLSSMARLVVLLILFTVAQSGPLIEGMHRLASTLYSSLSQGQFTFKGGRVHIIENGLIPQEIFF